ncbi:MAG: hypothetical protein IH991_14040, partial [Planctomycetes bacterium]|nr:hypothetical protein [Planctomycetota bacterium]
GGNYKKTFEKRQQLAQQEQLLGSVFFEIQAETQALTELVEQIAERSGALDPTDDRDVLAGVRQPKDGNTAGADNADPGRRARELLGDRSDPDSVEELTTQYKSRLNRLEARISKYNEDSENFEAASTELYRTETKLGFVDPYEDVVVRVGERGKRGPVSNDPISTIIAESTKQREQILKRTVPNNPFAGTKTKRNTTLIGSRWRSSDGTTFWFKDATVVEFGRRREQFTWRKVGGTIYIYYPTADMAFQGRLVNGDLELYTPGYGWKYRDYVLTRQ